MDKLAQNSIFSGQASINNLNFANATLTEYHLVQSKKPVSQLSPSNLDFNWIFLMNYDK